MSAPLVSPQHLGHPAIGLRAAELSRSGPAPLHSATFLARSGQLTLLLSDDTSGQALLRAAVGLDPVEYGTSVLDGHPVSRQPDQPPTLLPVQVGLLAPHPCVTAGASVDEHLAQWLVGDDERAKTARIRQVGESLGFSGLGTAVVGNLPPALQHRVALGRALAPAPTLIAAENPFSQLPERDRRMLEGLLRAVATDYGLAVLYASNRTESATSAHHVVRVVGGTVLEDLDGWPKIQRRFSAH